MRSLFSRDSRKAVEAPVIPKKLLPKRVHARLQQLAQETLHGVDSEDSENSLLQANNNSGTVETLENNNKEEEEESNRATIFKRPLDKESAQLLATIGSDLSDSSIAFFEEDASVSSSNRVVSQSPSKPTSLLGNAGVEAGESLLVSTTTPRSATAMVVKNRLDDAIAPSQPSSLSFMITSPVVVQKFVVGTTMTTLLVCFVYQVLAFPTTWIVWTATSLSLYCATFLWPKKTTPYTSKATLFDQRQKLLSEGLPYKSRLVVAQANVRRLQYKVKLLQDLQKVQERYVALQQESAVALTTQALIKSNKSATSTHLNALALSILPAKLATMGVKLHMSPLSALAKSRRGSRAILVDLYRDLVAPHPTMFRYPPLLQSQRETAGAPTSAKKRAKSQRVDDI